MTEIVIPFADVESSMNTDVMGMLANAVATVVLPADVSGERFAVTFDNAYLYVDMGSGIESTAPAATVLEELMSEAVRDALEVNNAVALSIGGITYRVVERQPDGKGVSFLRLRKEA